MPRTHNELSERNKRYNQDPLPIAETTFAVLDVRGMRGFAVFLQTVGTVAGTATRQPCFEDGTVVPGSASAAVANGAFVSADWPFYRVNATKNTCHAAVV